MPLKKTTFHPWWDSFRLPKTDPRLIRMIPKLVLSAGILYLCLLVCDIVIANDRPDEQFSTRTERKLVFFGFQGALYPGDGVKTVQSPLTGAAFEAEPVEENIVQNFTDEFYERLVQKKGWNIISPDQARGVFYAILLKAPASSDKEIMLKIGRVFSAKGVLAGYVYRWRERRGSGLAVDSPASVAFDLCLIDTDTAKILWKGRYDKTQRPLSENLFDARTFWEGKGKWMTAKDLANIGVRKIMDEYIQYEMEVRE